MILFPFFLPIFPPPHNKFFHSGMLQFHFLWTVGFSYSFRKERYLKDLFKGIYGYLNNLKLIIHSNKARYLSDYPSDTTSWEWWGPVLQTPASQRSGSTPPPGPSRPLGLPWQTCPLMGGYPRRILASLLTKKHNAMH